MNQNILVPYGIDVRDENNHSLMEIRPMDMSLASKDEQARELDLHSISQLNSLLTLVPSSASAVAGNAKNLMMCSFDYSKLIQANDGSGAIGTVYKEGTNKFGAQARFNEASTLKSAVNTGLLLNLASQVLAQKHLADINERLKSIEVQVKGIQKFLEKSRFTKIQAFQEHLQRIGMLLQRGEEVLPDTLKILAHKAQDIRAEVVHIRHDLGEAQQDLDGFDSESLFGSSDIRDLLKEKIQRFSNLQREYLLGMQSLLVANLILYVKNGGNKEFVYAGETYLAELQADEGLLAQWGQAERRVKAHLNKMKPVFEFARSTQANELMVESSLAKVQQMIDGNIKQIQQLQQKIVDAQSPRIMLEVHNGRVVRGNYLS